MSLQSSLWITRLNREPIRSYAIWSAYHSSVVRSIYLPIPTNKGHKMTTTTTIKHTKVVTTPSSISTLSIIYTIVVKQVNSPGILHNLTKQEAITWTK